MKTNLMKQKLQAGKVAAGVIMSEASPQVAELLGVLGFDWLFIDNEHALLSLSEINRLVLAAELRNITPLLRVPQNLPEVILPYLDIGIMGIVIPGVETADDARRAVRGVKYPPEGVRGLSGGRVSDFGLRGSLGEYVKTANRETLVLPVVESRSGLAHIDEILQTEGIDGVIIGANDLSMSLGVPGQTSHPEVLKAMDTILAAALKAGKPIGAVVRGGETPGQYIDKGYQMVLTSLPALIVPTAKNFLEFIPK